VFRKFSSRPSGSENPRLRQAASTLCDSGGHTSAMYSAFFQSHKTTQLSVFWFFSYVGQRRKKLKLTLKTSGRMEQKYFINRWLSPCGYAHTAPPTQSPKMTSPFLGSARPPPLYVVFQISEYYLTKV